jgi:hypothetical protein
MRSTISPLAVSSTSTWPSSWLGTYSSRPSSVVAGAKGRVPTGTVRETASVAVSRKTMAFTVLSSL